MTKKQTAVAERIDERAVEYVPFGATDRLKLTASMVQQFVAVPTKSGKLPSMRECIKFIMLCKGKRANPFEGDCYLIGYDSRDGATFSLVCGIEMFLKRASADPAYDGMESGIIAQAKDGSVISRQGAMSFTGEKIVGGWARVHRKDQKNPTYKSIKMEVYDSGHSRWAVDPGGMIEKVAVSQALRTAFPTALGGLHTAEEMSNVTVNAVPEREPITMPVELPQAAEPEPVPPAKPQEAETDKDGWQPDPQEQLLIMCEEAGISEARLLTVLRHDKFITEFENVMDLKVKDAKLLMGTIGQIKEKAAKLDVKKK